MKYNPSIVLAWFVANNLPTPVAEHKFALPRKWRFDFAWPAQKVALEVEGAVWTGGRHTRGSGFVADMEKYNEAAAMGWRIVRCQPRDICTHDVVETIWRALKV